MGRAKERHMAELARGFYPVGDKYACENCFDDYAICEFIKANADEKECGYCGRRSTEPIAAHIDGVIEFILEGIKTEWGDPNNEGVPWEGGWVGKVIDSYDLIVDEIALGVDNEELLQDIIDSIVDHQWCQRHFYLLQPEEALAFGWAEFSEQVKHHTRYVFFRASDELKDFQGREEILPSQMLDKLAHVVSEVGITNTIEAGTLLWRVRIHHPSKSFDTASELGSPMPENALYSNRMSPAGIPMFYGAFDEETALAETFEARNEELKVATIAIFKTLRKLRVLDLTKLPDVPSIFDQHKRRYRPSIKFLRAFVADISKPIEKDGREHIEYVPTQVFTEYIRHIYEGDEGNKLEGIVYSSARCKNGVACVLFLQNKHCCDALLGDDSDASKYLFLVEHERKPL